MSIPTFAPAAPLVSVIMPVRDRAGCVARAIRSVLAQSYHPIELIVIDDGSRDGTLAVVQGFGDAVRVIRQEGGGAYAARNRGLAEARGALIAFVDSDDAWHPDKLAQQVPLFTRDEIGLVFGDVRHVRLPCDDAEPVGLTSFAVAPPSRGRVAAAFAYCNFVPTSAAVVRRTCLDEIGGFASGARLSADYLAWFRIALRHQFEYVDGCVADYTVHAAGISHDLGRSLDARLRLFGDARAQTADRRVRAVLRHLLFNLALSRLIALARGRLAGRGRWVDVLLSPFRLGGAATPLWLVGFLRFQVRRRCRQSVGRGRRTDLDP